MVEILGSVFHYAVVEPEDDHARCEGQAAGVIAMHERMGYRQGGAYNGHFCQHGGSWISYYGPNQATGDTWANLNLHAWCYLATVGTPVTDQAAQAAYDLTLVEPSGRDQIYPHSAFYATSCCGDPLREWIANGALPPSGTTPSPSPRTSKGEPMILMNDETTGAWQLLCLATGWLKPVAQADALELVQSGIVWMKLPADYQREWANESAAQAVAVSSGTHPSVTVPAGPFKIALSGSAIPA